MAKTQAPFLSLGARGQLAKTVVAASWKGIKTMRQYVVPANPRTSAQVAHREDFADSVALWKSFITEAGDIAAWNRVALQSGKPQSGFNSFTSNNLAALNGFTAYQLAKSWVEMVAGHVTTTATPEITGHGTGTVAYRLYVGPTEAKLTYRKTIPLITMFDYNPVAGDRFAKLVLCDGDGNYVADCSGIYAVTTA